MECAAYLARFDTAKVVYADLLQAALKSLPAQPSGGLEKLVVPSFYVTANKADDVRRLETHRWVSHGFLGNREGDKLHLLADIVAAEITGVSKLVSSEVLGLKDVASGKAAPSRSYEASGRGLSRSWAR